MSIILKYAIVDTDFVSKSNIIKTEDRVLADEVLEFPEYKFFCHQKMVEELEDHGTGASREWLNQKIKSGKITLYSDEQIIKELVDAVGEKGYSYYRSFLKDGCNMVTSNYYSKYFKALDNWFEADNKYEDFLSTLADCEASIGHKNNYGEIKAFVLLKTLSFLFEVKPVIFCSDDAGARKGFSNTSLVPCISILSLFLKLKYLGRSFEGVWPYYRSFIDWCLNRKFPQTTVKVWIFKAGTYKRESVPIENILRDIYDGKYEARLDGDLQMKRKNEPPVSF